MATDKRARQRANREVKKAAEAAAARKANLISRTKKAALWIGLMIVVFVIANLVFAGSAAAAIG